MKKLFFTGIALVAFSVTSSASSGKVEIVDVKKIIIETELIDPPRRSERGCETARVMMVLQAAIDGWDAATASSMGWSVYFDCKLNG